MDKRGPKPGFTRTPENRKNISDGLKASWARKSADERANALRILAALAPTSTEANVDEATVELHITNRVDDCDSDRPVSAYGVRAEVRS